MLERLVLVLVLLGSPTPNAALETQLSSYVAPIEEVVVTGVRPGPPLWKVTHNDHVLWVFATLTPIPQHIEWDSEAVEFIISKSTAYLKPPEIFVTVRNPIKGIGYWRRLSKLKKLPNKQTLEQVLTPELSAQFENIRAQYAPRNRSIRTLRPSFAAEKLLDEAVRTVGLTDATRQVTRPLRKMAKRYDLSIIESAAEAPVEDLFTVLQRLSMATESECLAATLRSIEQDMNAAAKRANAWADGDASALLAMDYPDVEGNCTKVIFERPEAAVLQQQVDKIWLQNAETALQQNSVTFAELPIRDVVHSQGLLARLAAQGYTVSSPAIAAQMAPASRKALSSAVL